MRLLAPGLLFFVLACATAHGAVDNLQVTQGFREVVPAHELAIVNQTDYLDRIPEATCGNPEVNLQDGRIFFREPELQTSCALVEWLPEVPDSATSVSLTFWADRFLEIPGNQPGLARRPVIHQSLNLYERGMLAEQELLFQPDSFSHAPQQFEFEFPASKGMSLGWWFADESKLSQLTPYLDPGGSHRLTAQVSELHAEFRGIPVPFTSQYVEQAMLGGQRQTVTRITASPEPGTDSSMTFQLPSGATLLRIESNGREYPKNELEITLDRTAYEITIAGFSDEVILDYAMSRGTSEPLAMKVAFPAALAIVLLAALFSGISIVRRWGPRQ